MNVLTATTNVQNFPTSIFAGLSSLENVKGFKNLYKKTLRHPVTMLLEGEANTLAEAVEYQGRIIPKSIKDAMEMTASMSREACATVIKALTIAIERCELIEVEEVVETKPARKPMFTIVGASTITINEPKTATDKVVEQLDVVVDRKIEEATSQDDIVAIEDVIEDACADLDENDFEVVTNRYKAQLDSAWVGIVEANKEEEMTTENYEIIIEAAFQSATTQDDVVTIEDLIEDAWSLSGVENLNEVLGAFEDRLDGAWKKVVATNEADLEEAAPAIADTEEIIIDVVAEVTDTTEEVAIVEVTAPIIEEPTEVQTTANEVGATMLSIRYTNTQREILETVIDNFELEGESVLLKTKVKFDVAFGQALVARLERLVKMNKRSINSLLKKLNAQLNPQEEETELTVETPTVIEAVTVEESKPVAFDDDQVAEAIVEVQEADAEEVEVEEATQEEEAPEVDIYAEFTRPPETHVREFVEPPLFSANFHEKMEAKRKAREAHWNQKPQVEEGKRWVDQFKGVTRLTKDRDNTQQPVAQPVDMTDW